MIQNSLPGFLKVQFDSVEGFIPGMDMNPSEPHHHLCYNWHDFLISDFTGEFTFKPEKIMHETHYRIYWEAKKLVSCPMTVVTLEQSLQALLDGKIGPNTPNFWRAF